MAGIEEFIQRRTSKAKVPGCRISARELYNLYAFERLDDPSPEPTPSFNGFLRYLRENGYRVARNKAKYQHGRTIIQDLVINR